MEIETPEAPEAEAPVVETPETEALDAPVTEAVDTEIETPDPEAPESEDPFSAYGGKDEIDAASRVWQATKSQDGQIQLFFELGRNLGLGVRDLEAVFGAPGTTEAEATEPEDLDRPLTAAEFAKWQQDQVAATQKSQQEQAVAAARTTIQSTLADLKVDPADHKAILDAGDKYLQRGVTDPQAIADAVRRGHADYLKNLDAAAKRYLTEKKAAAAKVPSSPSGTAASEPPAEEPKSVAEAIKAVRARMNAA